MECLLFQYLLCFGEGSFMHSPVMDNFKKQFKSLHPESVVKYTFSLKFVKISSPFVVLLLL